MSISWYEAVMLGVLIVLGFVMASNRRKPMATWKRRAFRDSGDDPISDHRSSIDTFKRMHRY